MGVCSVLRSVTAQNQRKCTLGANLENQLFSKNDLHSPENNTTYFFVKSEAEVF